MTRIVQLTDTHIYADAAARFDGVDTRASLRAVLAHLHAGPPYDLLVLSGDLSMDGSRASEVFEPAKGCVNGSSPAGREPSFRPADCGGGGRSVKTRSRVPARR